MGQSPRKKALAASFDIVAQDDLREAAGRNDAAAVRALFKKHPDAFSTYAAQQALFDAVQSESADTVRALLEGGVNPNLSAREGRLTLGLAALKGVVEIAELLLDHGADINKPDTDGCTPLLLATWKNNLMVARLLVDRGADINRANANGETPLILGIVHDHEKVTRLLLDRGAALDLVDNDGVTAMSAAQEYEEDLYVRLIGAAVAKRIFDAAARIDAEAAAASEKTLDRLQQRPTRGIVLKKKNPPFEP